MLEETILESRTGRNIHATTVPKAFSDLLAVFFFPSDPFSRSILPSGAFRDLNSAS